MQYLDLTEFETFVKERGLVKEEHCAFYLLWVRRFLQAEFNASELAQRDKVECFADQLARDSQVKDCLSFQSLLSF